MLEESAEEKAANTVIKEITSREKLTDEKSTDGKFAYRAEYKTTYGGVTYWERLNLSYWKDVTTNKDYFALIDVLVPEKDKDAYKSMIDRMLDNLEDI